MLTQFLHWVIIGAKTSVSLKSKNRNQSNMERYTLADFKDTDTRQIRILTDSTGSLMDIKIYCLSSISIFRTLHRLIF